MDKETLLPCPFCGGEADVDIGNFGGMVCYCKKCFSQGKQCKTKEEAIEAWNRRAKGNDNREWLFSLNNKDLAKVLHEAPFECCSVCPHDGVDCLGADDCMDAIEPWLEAKHGEG